MLLYNSILVYCRELAPGTVRFTGDRAQGDDSKHDSHYSDNYLLQLLRKQVKSILYFNNYILGDQLTLSLLAATFVCHLLITFANSLDSDQDQLLIGPDLSPKPFDTQRLFWGKQ